MNNVSLTGRLTDDINLRTTAGENPTSVANVTVAVDRDYRREGQPTADFISVVVWGKQAEWLEKWCKKGTKIEVTGRIETRNYENKEGQKVYVTEVRATNVGFAESKKAAASADTPAAPATAPEEALPQPDLVDDEGLPFN